MVIEHTDSLGVPERLKNGVGPEETSLDSLGVGALPGNTTDIVEDDLCSFSLPTPGLTRDDQTRLHECTCGSTFGRVREPGRCIEGEKTKKFVVCKNFQSVRPYTCGWSTCVLSGSGDTYAVVEGDGREMR